MPSGAVGSAGKYEIGVDIAPLTIDQQKTVRLGMSAQLSILTYSAVQATVVPAGAIRRKADGAVFVVHRTSMLSPPSEVRITPGVTTPDGVEVSGIGAGYVLVDSIATHR